MSLHAKLMRKKLKKLFNATTSQKIFWKNLQNPVK